VDVANLQRESYDRVLDGIDGRFVLERPAMFSPAAAAQDEVNGKGGLHQRAAMFLPVEFTNWVDESRAHVESCYVGDWSALGKVVVRGTEAADFLSSLGPADASKLEVGRLRHQVQLDNNGWIASEGVLGRLAEEEFLYTAGSIEWLTWRFGEGSWDAEIEDVTPDRYILGVQGPTSLSVLEKLTGESLRDIAFNHGRESSIGELPLRIHRTGISGELGYELHGSAEHANDVWAAVRDAGEEFGVRQLGGRSQSVQHIEAGIATNGLDYLPSSAITPGAPRLFRRRTIGGSFVPGGFTDYFRKPAELGWGPRDGTVPEHEFSGRGALLADVEAGGTPRTLVGLIWNSEDVVDVFAALFRDGDVPDQMDVPRRLGPAFDRVLVDGEDVGVSTGRVLSANVRATISLCVIDRALSAPGSDVVVVWGRAGTPQREIRARVVELPFKPDRRRTDVTALPAS